MDRDIEAEYERHREDRKQAMNRPLSYWREMGTVTATRYPKLYVWHQAPGLWRHLWADDDDDHDVTLDQFKTKMEALAGLPEAYEWLWGENA
jgi:hypothetical protein